MANDGFHRHPLFFLFFSFLFSPFVFPESKAWRLVQIFHTSAIFFIFIFLGKGCISSTLDEDGNRWVEVVYRNIIVE